MMRNRLAHVLIDKRMTSTELAKRSGLSRNIISQIKNNPYHNITADSVGKISRALGIPATAWIEVTDTMPMVGSGQPL